MEDWAKFYDACNTPTIMLALRAAGFSADGNVDDDEPGTSKPLL
jgi:hypothetical protein